MKMYDVTATIYEGMTVYKNKPEKQPKFNTVTNGYVTETRMELDVHTGTHVDAPLHMVVDGDTFESVPLEDLVGQAKLFDLTDVEDGITKADLEKFDIEKGDFVLLKTKNSFEEEFNFDFIYLTKDGAEYLSEIGVRGVGIDTLGIERDQEGHPTHKTLFGDKIIIIEGLRFKEVAQGEYFMVAAPLKIEGTDASPARVLLFEGLR
ncbi:cyclase family protein [Sporosarcina pasteurii]|uniref:Kynurenine formamidase n=1 Tax=Sporosarcina pasteurii TaxID=1474 RepID=A0A380BDD5_SPOPA|nr:cyclase family protein [Sporosarcina pasteurii]MDS9472909.1 cyclase family protein [Sporosarcina pasteurii]QBQ06456.1 cyclase family protein [Sporosarcina pasteurii]SUI98433.1 Kynurenine formamidase [Sporosarcina pasteurii]